MIRFVTDGTMVYELLAVRVVRNAGLMGGIIRTYLLLPLSADPDSTETIVVNEEQFNRLKPVEPAVEHEVLALRADLERWLTEGSSWLS